MVRTQKFRMDKAKKEERFVLSPDLRVVYFYHPMEQLQVVIFFVVLTIKLG